MKKLLVLALVLVAACDVQTTAVAPDGAAATGAPAPRAFLTRNGIKAYPLSATKFEVHPGTGARSDDFWCGASEYARRALGRGWSDRVYVASGVTPSQVTGRRSTVQFTVDPQKDGVTPIDTTFRSGFKVGDNMSINQANGRCTLYRPFFDR